jgi:O-antigen/teichoic acid export membrane protein
MVRDNGFDMPHLGGRIVQNISALTVAQLFYRMVMLGMSVLLARYLGVVEQGVYSLAMNFIAMFQAFSDLGIANLVIRDMNQRSCNAASLIGQYLRLLIVANVLLVAAAVVTAIGLGYDMRLVAGILLAGLGMVFIGLSSAFYAGLAGMERMKLIAVLEIGMTLILATGTGIVMVTGGTMLSLTLVAAVGGAARLVLFGRPVLKCIKGISLTGSFGEAVVMLKRGLPFTLHVGMYIVLTRIDVVFVEMFTDAYTLGLYTAATRLTFPLTILTMMTATAIFPVVSRGVKNDPASAHRLVRSSMSALFILGLCIALPVSLWAAPIIGTVFGNAFIPAAPYLSIVVWYVPIFSLYQVVSDLLVASDRVWGVVIIGALCLAVNVACNLVFIPMVGAVGAAWTTLVSEALRCVLFIGFAVTALGFLKRKVEFNR